MCGIAGIIANKDFSEPAIKLMVDKLIHRGPDDDGYLIEEKFSFGMRRLSIIDLSRGKQPITNEDGDIVVVFNGEIYNYQGLCADLKEKGHIFKTESDTETLVHLYEEYGEAMVSKLRGMFGFSIFDRKNNRLFIARDQFGIKPLYYRIDNEGPNHGHRILSFASEIKSLLADSRYALGPDKINREAVGYYLQFQYNPLEETFFKDIFVLLPGHAMTVDLNDSSFKIHQYWQYDFAKNNTERSESLSSEEILKKFSKDIYSTISDSVEHHLISDVPVGAFLSGGVDSAIIVTLMQKLRLNAGLDRVQTFTIGFDEVSELAEAREVAEKIGTKHTEIKIGFDEYLAELPKIAWHFDQPVADPSAVALYFLAREARKSVKVVLSGEGADELFGGYNIYREPFALMPMQKLPNWFKSFILRPISKVLGFIPFDFYGKNYFRRAITPVNERYIGNARIFSNREVASIYRPTEDKKAGGFDTSKLLSTDYQNFTDNYWLNPLTDSQKMQLIDMKHWLPGDILAKADKMTMAHSLEARVPFLDMRVAEISAEIPEDLKYKNGTTKYALRKAFEEILPKTTAGRKKLGFPIPIRHWLKNDESSAQIKETILSNGFIKTDFDVKLIENLFSAHKSGSNDSSRKIFILLMLALWYNAFIDVKAPAQL